jgi:hypothetical protein
MQVDNSLLTLNAQQPTSNTQRPTGDRNHGFTLVETAVAAVSAAILVLTMTALLVQEYRGMASSQAAAGLQDDSAVALDMIARAVRPVASTNVTVAAGLLVAGTRSFTRSGGDLVYDPDTGTGGDEVTIIRGRVVSFVPTHLPGTGVHVALALQEGPDDSLSIEATTTFRN